MSPKVELWTSRTKGRAPTNCAIRVLAFMRAAACFYSCRGILCIHPSFRIIGLAEPPVVGGSSQQQWLNSELLSMFLFHHVRPLSKKEEAQVIYEMVNTLESLHCAKFWENSRHFATSPLVSPSKWRLSNECRNSILMTFHYPDLSSGSDWLRQISSVARPIRRISHISVVTRHQMEFLQSFLRRHFAGKPVVAPRNIVCFL